MQITAYHPFKSEKAKERYLTFYDTEAKKWPVDSETRMVNTSYGQTFLRISGPVDTQPLVLLPGFSGNSLMWIPNIKALSECYRTYALDNIYDNGRSIYTRPITSPDDFVKWLDELFNALEFGDNINLMGLSYGGWLTSLYALRYPNRLNKIVLLAPAATVLPLRLSFYIYGFPTFLLPLRYFSKRMFFRLMEDSVKKDEISRMWVEDFIDNMFIASRCFKPRRPCNPTVLEDQELQSIKVPALYVVGENEKIYSAQKAVQHLSQVAPHIKTETIPSAGHDLTFVQAEMVNKKVLDFLQQP
ncbi:MAG TPA: alpha/beta hydrolase [Dehalococcoidia bacterium]|nr:alpha/beta hydrolase [Dehalococcoidia bacterium]